MTTTVGIISDIHRRPAKEIEKALAVLQQKGATHLVLNGDIGNCHSALEESLQRITTIVEAAGKSGLETYVQPGSHETITAYQMVLDVLTQTYANITDMVRQPSVDVGDYRLAFLPGSYTLFTGAEYPLQTEEPTGFYIVSAEGVAPFSAENFNRLANEGKDPTRMHFTNINYLKTLVSDPERTVVFCHEPARFDEAKEHGVDFAYFAKSKRGFLPGILLERELKQREGRDLSREELDKVAQSQGFTFHRENVGSEELRALFDELGILYAVNGHIHESSHHAHTRTQIIAPGTLTPELFWNSGCFDYGLAGILVLEDNGVRYLNVRWTE